MCIAIYKPADKKISKRILARCWNNNEDGAGFMYAQDGVLHIDKGYFQFKTFWKAVRHHICDEPKALVIHFRIATSGKVDHDNCHPFLVHDGLGLAHNGIISELNDGVEKCDTLRMASILSHLPPNFTENESIMKLVELAVGTGNKFVFMDNLGKVSFINQDAGIEVDGVWYSNGSFRYDRYYTSASSKGRDSDYGGYSWERGIYSGGTYYGKEQGYRYSPHTESINRVITPSEKATLDTAEGTLGSTATDAEVDVRVPRHSVLTDTNPDIPPSALFKQGQRYDEFIDETYDPESGEVYAHMDAFGYTEDDYESFAYSEACFWIRHHESLNPAAFQELTDILDMADEGEPIRVYMQDWLDENDPKVNSVSVARQIEAEQKAARFLKGGTMSIETRREQDKTPGERVAEVLQLSKDVAAVLKAGFTDDDEQRQLLLEGCHE